MRSRDSSVCLRSSESFCHWHCTKPQGYEFADVQLTRVPTRRLPQGCLRSERTRSKDMVGQKEYSRRSRSADRCWAPVQLRTATVPEEGGATSGQCSPTCRLRSRRRLVVRPPHCERRQI